MSTIKEEQIRPESIFNHYLELARIDTINFFDQSEKKEINCPGCNSEKITRSFTKYNFNYQECKNCQTLYVSPRPLKKYFDDYYIDSPSTEYWATTFYKVTEASRREKLWKPKAKKVLDILSSNKNSNSPRAIIDIGGGYGTFVEEFKELDDSYQVLVIEPSKHLSKILQTKGFNVITKVIEEVEKFDIPNSENAFVSFELFEHLHDPRYFLKKIFELMKPGEKLIFTTLSSEGIDIKLLGENSKSVSPPHHLNFFNPYSIKLLTKEIGYIETEVFTPGELDMDILTKNTKYIQNNYLKTLLENLDDSEKNYIQNILKKYGYSSHMWTICTK